MQNEGSYHVKHLGFDHLKTKRIVHPKCSTVRITYINTEHETDTSNHGHTFGGLPQIYDRGAHYWFQGQRLM